MTVQDEYKRIIGMAEKAKRAIGPLGGVIRSSGSLSISQRDNFLKLLDRAYSGLKTIQDDLTRGT